MHWILMNTYRTNYFFLGITNLNEINCIHLHIIYLLPKNVTCLAGAFITVHWRKKSGSVAVPLRFLSIEILSLFHHVLQYLRALYIVWSLVRRGVTRHLTRLQTMCNVLIYRKTFQTVCCGCGYFFNLLKTSTVPVTVPRRQFYLYHR